MKYIFLIAVVYLTLPAGCASPQARRGRVVEAMVGDHLSECGEDPRGPMSQTVVDIVHTNEEPGYVETGGFDSHRSKDGFQHHRDCHPLGNGVTELDTVSRRIAGLFGEYTKMVIETRSPEA